MTCLDESQKCDARLPRPVEVEFICRSDTYWAHLSSSRYFQRHTRFNSNANCGQSLCRQLIRRGAGAVTNGSLAGHDPRRLTRVSDPGCNGSCLHFGLGWRNLLPGRVSLFDRPRRFSACRFGLPIRLFLAILSTSSGSVRSISRRAIREYQGSRRKAETLLSSLDRPLGQVLAFARKCHYRCLSKVRDEKSHICCRAARKARSSIERNC
jgi:hypothetical protein